MEPILDTIRRTSDEFGSIPFWSWNDKLEEGRLRRQIRDMKALGMSGFFMHARGGLETEYLSDEWFDCVRVCVDEAKKLGMQAWAYDENGWPSGFAGGKLLHDKKNFALGLLSEDVLSFPRDEDTVAVYLRRRDGGFDWVKEPVEGAKSYLRIYRQYDESYVDTLNADLTRQFLELTHEVYRQKTGEDFGGAMPGFFTDEPQYFRWGHTYSNLLPDLFYKTYGYEIYQGLPAIFYNYDGAEKFRFDYYKLLHETFIQNWVKVVYDWCHAHGVQLTGHAVEESSLSGQMMCIGGVMPFYEYEDIPGIDYLSRGIASDLSPKQLGSVCAQLGKKKALSEMFACCGWDVSPNELKRIADLQYAGGVNLMCQHLYPYSERGQRKRDYPLHYSEHNPWQAEFGDLCRHYNKLGASLALGREYAPILVVHPMHGAYMKYKKGTNWLAEIDGKLRTLSDLLGHNQIPYHYGDENLMKRYARAEGGRLIVGQCAYDAVIIPFTYSLDHETAELLREYVDNGGRVWLFDGVPACVDGEKADLGWLKANMTFEDLLALRDAVLTDADGGKLPQLRKQTRLLEDGSRLHFLANITGETLDDVTMTIPESTAALLDIDTLELRPLYGEKTADGLKIALRFEDTESILILAGGEEIALQPGRPPRPGKPIPIPAALRLHEKPRNMITLDTAALSKDGVRYDEPLSIYGIKDGLLRERYDGDVWLKYTFTAEAGFAPSELRAVLEPMGYAEVTCNGHAVVPDPSAWWFDRSFATADIAPFVRDGENELIVRLRHHQSDYVYYVLYGGVSESLRNCLVFDTEIECAYLVGDFAVVSDKPFVPDVRNSLTTDGAFTLTAQKETVSSRDVVSDGYPFFGGCLALEFDYAYYDGMPTNLALDGRFAVCHVEVNGRDAGQMLFNRSLELKPFLHPGPNRIVLRMKNAMRNLMGPHHRSDPEPYGVGPGTFSFEKQWSGRSCADYRDRYSFVLFGAVKE